ncbi:MAG: amidohydrolase family protein, partial [Microbacterium sp.]
RPDDEVVNGKEAAGGGAVLTPGLVDLHGHGGGGFAYDDGKDAIRGARALHRAHGTTRAVISLVTAPLNLLAQRVSEIATLVGTDGVLGSHLEGPFLDPGHKGAHDPTLLREPHPDDVAALLEAGVHDGRQTIRQITLAPELPGGLEAVCQITDAGVICAIGHTDADEGISRLAIERGATLVTHAFNAMRPIHHRLPGPVPTAAADERVTVELIADGVHVAESVMRMLALAAPHRLALVTDAMAAAGMPDGDYLLGTLEVTVADGVARLKEGDSIAGSTLTLDAAIRHAIAFGLPLALAIEAATSTPARVIGESDRIGSLRPGLVGDAVLWNEDLRIVRVWADGEAVSATP